MSDAPPHRRSPGTPAATVLRALRERMRARGPETAMLFRTLAARLAAAPTDVTAVEELAAELHRVQGTAGSYGFSVASTLARDLERTVREWAAEPSLEPERRAGIVECFAAHLEAAFAAHEP